MAEYYSEFPSLIFFIWIGGVLVSFSMGSFYSTLAYRILRFYYGKERKIGSKLFRLKKILIEPSACESCGAQIKGTAIIPVFGYWISKKECTNCKAPINPLYSLSEAIFGLLFVVSFLLSGKLLGSFAFVALCGHLLVAASTDFKKFSLDYENLPFILLFGALANYLLFNSIPGKAELIVYVSFSAVFFLIYFIFPSSMGFADAIFAPAFAFISMHPWWIFFLNSSYGIAIIITVLKRKKGESLRHVPIPMGVYFSIGLALTFIARMIANSGLLPNWANLIL
ncbi:prepilin peptidase [Leptospira venezuelensis]|uniref:prepilin peptidase n=1 Tax=Leptospira venezuelensis TaxID=1958811 RepID=UPI000A3D2950|nr:A24 family peptidase [Leptospira venezuelensis]